MGKETKLYILDWNNGMVGIFKGSDLSQAANNTKSMLCWTLKHCMDLYGMKECIIEYLESHEQLNELRIQRGLEKKPTMV